MIWNAQGQRLKEDAKPAATRTVRISLILEKLVESESIKTTEAQIEEHLEKMASDLNTPLKTVKSVFAKDNRIADLEFQLATATALELVSNAAAFDEEKKGMND